MQQIHVSTFGEQSTCPADFTMYSALRFVKLLGLRTNLSGYRFLITAIVTCIEFPNMLNAMAAELYPAIAAYYHTSPQAVERNIRNAIENAYANDPEKMQSVFYYKIGKPSVSEVLALAVESIQLAYLRSMQQ